MFGAVIPYNKGQQIAIQHAIKKLGVAVEELHRDYQIRQDPSDDSTAIEYEFFSYAFFGDSDVEEMTIPFGGFPDFFSITVDEKKGKVVDTYMESL